MDHPEDVDLMRIWQVLARFRRLVLGTALVTAAAFFLCSLLVLKPVYKASSVILVSGETANPLSLLTDMRGIVLPVQGMGSNNARAETIAILKSRVLAAKVARHLDLQKEYAVESERRAVDRLRENIKVESGKEGQITVTARARRPRQAADIANTYISSLMEYRDEDGESAARRNLRFVETQLLRTRRELETAEQSLRVFQERHGLVALDADTEEILKQLYKMEGELAAARVGLEETRRSLQALRPRLVRRARTEGAPSLEKAASVDRLRAKLADLEADLLVATRAYTEEHPRVRELRATIFALKEQIRQLIARSEAAATQGIVPELITLEVGEVAGSAKEAALRAECQRLRQGLRKLPEAEMAYARLLREVKLKEAVYQTLSQEFYKAKIAAEQAAAPVRILDRAEVPLRKSSPRVLLNLALGVLLGLALGSLLAVLSYWLEGTRSLPSAHQPEHRVEPHSPRELEPTRH